MKPKDELLATLTLHGYSELKKNEQLRMREWLLNIVEMMYRNPKDFSKRFRAQYHRMYKK